MRGYRTTVSKLAVTAVVAMLVLSTAPLPVAADSEPDSIASARSVTVGTTVSGTIESGGDQDWFEFTVQRGKELRVEVTIPSGESGGSSLSTSLIDPDEARIDGGRVDPGTTAVRGATTVKSGTYYLQVTDYFGTSGPYSFRVVVSDVDRYELNQEPATATALTSGEPLSAAVSFLDADWYGIGVERGQVVRVDLEVPGADSGGSALNVNLYEPVDQIRSVAGGRADPGETTLIGDTAEYTGTYYVRVGDYFRTTGPYTLTVSVSDSDAFEPNERDVDAYGLFENPRTPDCGAITASDADWFEYDLRSGQTVEFTLTVPADGARLVPAIHAPGDTRAVAVGRVDPGASQTLTYTATGPGLHRLAVQSYFGTRSNYTFGVTVDGESVGLPNDRFERNENRGQAAGIEPKTYDDLAMVDDDEDWFSFRAERGDRVVATVRFAHADNDLTLELRSPGGEVVTTGRSSDDDETVDVVAAASGSYALRVTGQADQQAVYSLRLARAGGVNVAVGPGSASLAPGGTATYEVLVTGLTVGLGPYSFTVESTDTSVLTITALSVPRVPGSVSVAPDGSAAIVSTSVDQSVSGTAVVARVTVAADSATTGQARLRLRGSPSFETVAFGFDYPIAGIQSTAVTVSSGPTPIDPRYPAPGDRDGDGLYEDVNGDDRFNVIDVSIFLSEFSRAGVQDQKEFFDFTGDGTVNILDVADLLERT